MKRIALVASLACAAAAVTGGYLLIPGDAEKLAMLIRDGQEETALATANDLFASGRNEPTLLMQVFWLNQMAGAHDQAAKALDAYFLQRPDDAEAWLMASEAFDRSGQSQMLKVALENVVRLTHDAAAAGRLAAIYRLAGDQAGEMRVLAAVAPRDLSILDAIRLASLVAAQGNAADAASIVAAIDATERDLSDETRIEIFTLLLEGGQREKAMDLALRWQEGELPSPLTDVLVVYLLRAGAADAAFQLASRSLSLGDARASGRLAQMFFDEGRYDMVEQLMGERLAFAAALPADQLDDYMSDIVGGAVGRGLGTKLFTELFRVAASLDGPDVEASFLQAMYDELGYAGVAPFRGAVDPQILSRRPVLAARLMAAERNALQARRFLLDTDLRSQSATARAEWMVLARQMLSPAELEAELAWRARTDALPRDMLIMALDQMGRGGSRQQAMAVWRSVFDGAAADLTDQGAMTASTEPALPAEDQK